MKKFVETNEVGVKHECDVLVAGGGFAGIAAALSAARAGKKVILIEKSYILGGLGTSGLVTIYLPICDGYGRKVSYGSDAHGINRLADKREEVVAMLKEIGFTYITVPCRGEHIKVEI